MRRMRTCSREGPRAPAAAGRLRHAASSSDRIRAPECGRRKGGWVGEGVVVVRGGGMGGMGVTGLQVLPADPLDAFNRRTIAVGAAGWMGPSHMFQSTRSQGRKREKMQEILCIPDRKR